MTDQDQQARKERESGKDRPEVLIVSGDLGLTRFLHEGLLYAEFWPSEVGGGFQALEVFRMRDFDVVIVDASLPDLPYHAVARRLKGISASNKEEISRTKAPLLLVAGDQSELLDLEPDTEQLFSRTFIAPIEIDDLADAIHAILLDSRGKEENEGTASG